MAEQSNRVSYIKKPIARNSFPSLGLTTLGLAMFGIGITSAIRTQGQIPMYIAAVCFCSLLLSFCGVWYGVLALMEKEKNYVVAKISVAVGGFLLIMWLVLILIGLRG